MVEYDDSMAGKSVVFRKCSQGVYDSMAARLLEFQDLMLKRKGDFKSGLETAIHTIQSAYENLAGTQDSYAFAYAGVFGRSRYSYEGNDSLNPLMYMGNGNHRTGHRTGNIQAVKDRRGRENEDDLTHRDRLSKRERISEVRRNAEERDKVKAELRRLKKEGSVAVPEELKQRANQLRINRSEVKGVYW